MIGTGCVFVIGGNEEKTARQESILGAFVRRAGGADARIVIIPSASAEPKARARRYKSLFRALGAGNVVAVHAERRNVTPDDLQLLMNATGIFVTGGNQERLMRHLRATGYADVIVEAVRHGAVYAGTSAGAAAVSDVMIAGSRGKSVEIGTGLGLLRDLIVDQHFSERNRLKRLRRAVRERGLRGVGIDENTALVIEADGRTSVVGAGTVTFVATDGEVARHAAE